MKENIWSRRVFKKWAAINSKNYSYGRSKTLIKQRLIQTAPQALHHFGNQPLLRCLSEMNPPLNYQAVPRMVIAVVRKGRQKLRQKFESNKKMLKFDSKDENFIFKLNKATSSTKYYRCNDPCCSVVVHTDLEDNLLKIKDDHCHPPEPE
ncbi:unnamed protein product [Rotaria sp. Silwood2]|nr:unnamed protein product [Rotaria sp. Silwood2]